MARCQAGDRGAFDELVLRHQPAIRRLVRRYVQDDVASDVMQRAFEQAFVKIATFRAESSFRAWLFRIAVNTALNEVRGSARAAHAPLEDIASLSHSLKTSKLVAAEVWRKVTARLEDLPPKQRMVLELRIFHDLSFDEIATIVDSSADAAKMNFHHAVKHLRRFIPPP